MAFPGASETKFFNRFAAVVITGGSSGIGKEFLKAITQLSPRAVICNFSRSKPEDFPASPRQHHFFCDLSVAESIAAAVSGLSAVLETAPEGPLLLVNNGGFGAYGQFPEPDLARYEAMVAVNVTAPVKLTGLLWPVLKQRTGCVINVASIAAFQPTPFMGVYGASKAFLLHWSLALDAEGRRNGVRTLAVCPGPTRSAFFQNAGCSDALISGGSQSAEAVVRESLRALARGRTQVVTGALNKINAFFSARLPKPWAALLACYIINKLRIEQVCKK